ncbi:MAG: hypothetical protein D3M94_10185 [Rhodocyclales bacterium GT-UBC]|nr:MAG: hypothetical protein D3M94_10185 [Rhodocyclales bacterium GT-UBC]
MNTLKRHFFFGLIVLLLAACQSAPPAKGTANPENIALLKQAGFVQTDAGWEFSASEKLLFGTNEAVLTAPARQAVARIARLLLDMEITQVRIDGHTDNTGQASYNDQLSLRRAQAVADAMQAAGMPANGMTVRGLGSRIPVTDNHTSDGRAQNRRVVLVIAGS